MSVADWRAAQNAEDQYRPDDIDLEPPAAAPVESEGDALLDELADLIGVGTGHSSHWDRTGGHGAGCEECHRARDASTRMREIVAALRARLRSQESEPSGAVGYVVVEESPDFCGIVVGLSDRASAEMAVPIYRRENPDLRYRVARVTPLTEEGR